jgi:hypothetical protein
MVGVTGSIPVAPTIKPMILLHFWNRSRPDCLQLGLRQQHVNSKQPSAAVLLNERDHTISGERDVRERVRIVGFVIRRRARAITYDMTCAGRDRRDSL